MKLTIIGSGAMAIALADGLINSYELEFIARDEQKLIELSQRFGASYQILEENSIEGESIILAIKPYALEDVSQKLKGEAKVIYSILAGTTIEALKHHIDSKYIIRAMPNVASSFGASATALTGDEALRDEALEIFDSVGVSIWLNSQKELDIATAIAGSGPAYLALVAEAMMDGGVKQGLKRADSMRFVEALFGGFAPLISSRHPALIKDSVMSPAGTTASGYASLEESGVRDGFIKAIESAFMVTQKGK
jgi:pyrroline-5-carboxylate reductase